MFNLKGKLALITGGGGVLGSNMARTLANQGVVTIVLGLTIEKVEATATSIRNNGGEAFAISANVTNKEELEKVRDFIIDKYGRLDILINAAGGNKPGATISPDQAVYDM